MPLSNAEGLGTAQIACVQIRKKVTCYIGCKIEVLCETDSRAVLNGFANDFLDGFYLKYCVTSVIQLSLKKEKPLPEHPHQIISSCEDYPIYRTGSSACF